MVENVKLGEMISQSIAVLTKPSVETFEQFEKRGGQREALIYVIAAAIVGGIVALVFGLIGGGIGGALGGVIAAVVLPIVSFFVFAFLIHFVGQRQGGTGTQDEVFYTTALYTAPILAINGVLGNVPLLNCLALPVTLLLSLYQLYLAYLATRSSMNLDSSKGLITVIVAIVAMWIAAAIIGGIFAAIGIGSAVMSGALTQ